MTSDKHTEAKHTPGPWITNKFGTQVLTGDSWNTICTLPGDAEWEDKRGTYEPEYAWQNQEANARLIAAAPELLEALRKLRAEVAGLGRWDYAFREIMGNTNYSVLVQRMDEAGGIIAKAGPA